jgi:hypothetical protein
MSKKHLKSFRNRVREALKSFRIRSLKREILGILAAPMRTGYGLWLGLKAGLTRMRREPRRQQSDTPRPLRSFGTVESLEPRVLLAADLQYPSGANDLTLTYDSTSFQFRLVESLNPSVVVAYASASDAVPNGIRVTGSAGADTLRLDVAKLPDQAIAFLGSGTDTVVVSIDADISVEGNSIQVSNKEFVLSGFEAGSLVGGDSANQFTLTDPSIPFAIDGKGGTDTLASDQYDANSNAVWLITSVAGGTTGKATFQSIERLEGGSRNDEFRLIITQDAAVEITSLEIDGGEGSDKLVAPAQDNTWIIQGENTGVLNEQVRFSAVENVTGNQGKDTFQVTSMEALDGTIDGGDGDDLLVGPDSDSQWRLSGVNAGQLNTKAFTNIESLTGGSRSDAFGIYAGGSLSGLLDGGLFDADSASINTIDFTERGSAVSVDLELESATGLASFSRIDRLLAGPGNDLLTGPEALLDQTTWSITGLNSGTVDGVAFDGFERLKGQNTSNDAFVFSAAGSLSGNIDGGSGGLDGFAVADTAGLLLAYQPSGLDQTGTVTVRDKQITFSGIDNYTPWSGDNTHRIFTGSVFDKPVVLADADSTSSGNMVLSFTGLSFTSGLSTYTFANPSQGLSVITGTGGDDITVQSLDPAFSGSLIRYSGGVLRADLRSVADTSTLSLVGPSLDDGLIVTLAVNSVSTSFGRPGQGVKTITIDGKSGDDLFEVTEVLPIEVNIVGGDGLDALTGPSAGTQWEITGTNSGSAVGITSFIETETIRGSAGDDRFNFRSDSNGTGSLSVLLDGGLGTDEVVGGDLQNTWRIEGNNSGAYNTTTAFSNIENVTGGSNRDDFVMVAGGALSGILDGGLDFETSPGGAAAIDTLDYSSRATAVEVMLGNQTATSLGSFDRMDNRCEFRFSEQLSIRRFRKLDRSRWLGRLVRFRHQWKRRWNDRRRHHRDRHGQGWL